MKEWYTEESLFFNLATDTKEDKPFELIKFVPKKKYNYVLDFFKEYINLINEFQVVALYSKKDMGKSFVGYLWAKDYFKQNIGNMLYGRIQDKEKQNARSELFSIFEKMNLAPYYEKKYSRDYIFFANSDYNCRLVNISSYQSLRGAIGDNNNFIWFDEINAHNFSENFGADFINILSTLGRKNNFKCFLSGNNETAVNNPVLNALQLKFDWNYNGVQMCTRTINGVKILGIQLGYEAFETKELSIAERLAINNPAVYQTYYLGQSNINDCNRIINLKEDYTINKILFYYAEADKLFSFNLGSVNDEVNNIKADNCFLVKEEPYNYDSNHFNNKIKLYTTSLQSDLIFKKAILMKDINQIGNFFKPFIEAIKNEKLFFCDFLSNDTFLTLFVQYHPARIEKGVFVDERKK